MDGFKIGDRVVCTRDVDGQPTSGRYGTVAKQIDSYIGVEFDTPLEHSAYRTRGYWSVCTSELEHTTKPKGEGFMSSVFNRVKELSMGEPLKSFVQYGIKNKDGALTDEGSGVLLHILASKYEADLVELVDKLKAEDKAAKK